MPKNQHNLSCWCGKGTSCCSYYSETEPHIYCFKCEETNFNSDIIEEILLEHTNEYPTHKEQNDTFVLKRGIISGIETRQIKQTTAEKYGVEKLFNGLKEPYAYSFPYHSLQDNSFIAQKIKDTATKNITCYGNWSECSMFGVKQFPQGGKYITITEGEEDALAAYQMQYESHGKSFDPAVISLSNGASSAERDCKHNWEYLNSFENIIVNFDGDSVGKKAAEKVAQLFPYKVKIVSYPDTHCKKDPSGKKIWYLKDACDYLKEGKIKEYVNLWYRAEKYSPKGVRSFRSLWDDMTQQESSLLVPFPWNGINTFVQGMITGKMDVFKANPKVGKTSILSELIMHVRGASSYNVGVIFLENTVKEIGLKLCGIDMNLPLDHPNIKIDLEELKRTHDKLSEDDRLMIFDPKDERTAENIFNKIMFFVKAHDCKFIFFDHVSMLAYSSDSGDERKFLDKLFADLKQLTTTLNIYLGVVIHVNDDGKTRGSRAPVQLCDRLYSLVRDKTNEDTIIANTTEFIVEENRYGQAGLAAKLFYDIKTGRIEELDLKRFKEEVDKNKREVIFDD